MTQKSRTMIEAMGPRNTAYAAMKFKKLPALAKIFQGTRAHAKTAQSNCPLRIFTYWGKRAVRSFAAESEFAEMLTPRAARANEKAAKKRQARLGQLAMRAMGSHCSSP